MRERGRKCFPCHPAVRSGAVLQVSGPGEAQTSPNLWEPRLLAMCLGFCVWAEAEMDFNVPVLVPILCRPYAHRLADCQA